ncbi:MAG: short chain dehydrogenase [Puniceicoccales bacterium]
MATALIVGGNGTIGRAVVEAISDFGWETIVAGLSSGDVQVDIASMESIQAMYQQLPALDAVISTTGKVHFGALTEFTAEQFAIGLSNKLMGQVNLVMAGLNKLNDGGSFTLTSGILSHDPIPAGCSAAMVNGAIDAFVRSAAIELPRGLRINAVSPTLITESAPSYGPFFPGFKPVDAATAALSYLKSVAGRQTGQVYAAV